MSESDRLARIDITSPTNARVKWLVDLRRRRSRDLEGLVAVDGYDEVLLACSVGADVRTLFVCPDLITDPGHVTLVDRLVADGVEVVTLGRAAGLKASYRQSPDGFVAVVGDPTRSLAALRLSAAPLVLVAEGIEKPGNLGAMLRTAEAAGLDAVIAADPETDWGNPNVVRASKGTVFAVPVARGGSEEVLGWLVERGLRIVVATAEAASPVTEMDLRGPVAIVVGAEHAGLTAVWRSAALGAGGVGVSIPMRGRVNSLNVSTAAAVVVYEAIRQRA